MTSVEHLEEFYVTVSLVRPLVLGLRVLGLDVEALCQRANVSLEQLTEPDGSIEMERVFTLIREAGIASGWVDLGLRLAALYEPGVFGALDHLARSGRTLSDAINVLCRYERIHQNGMHTLVQERDGIVTIDHRVHHHFEMPREISDNTLGNLVVIGRRWTGVHFVPQEVRIAHPAPPDQGPYERLFGSPIVWEAQSDALVLPASVMSLPLLLPNVGLSRVLDGYVQRLLIQRAGASELVQLVRERICALMPKGDASLERIAEEFEISPRTLQRRLREESTSHGQLLEQIRRDLCTQYLKEAQLGVDDIGLMLGFSDGRAFRRAFKRWTGATPSETRVGLAFRAARRKKRPS